MVGGPPDRYSGPEFQICSLESENMRSTGHRQHPHQNHDIVGPDADACAIGDLYRKARLSLVESVRFAIARGQRLKAKQNSLPHGAWLPWLRDYAQVLGFRDRTASRLMKLAANDALTSHFDETTAITFSRQLWGNNDDQADPADLDRDTCREMKTAG